MFGVGVVGRSINSEWGRAVGPGSWMDWVGWGYCLDQVIVRQREIHGGRDPLETSATFHSR